MNTKELVKRFIKNIIPWRARYLMKLFEAETGVSLPMKYKADNEEYYQHFFDLMGDLGASDLRGKRVCELGPGQKLTHAPLVWQLGGEGCYFLDIADLASADSEVVLDKYTSLPQGMEPVKGLPEVSEGERWSEYLEKLGSVYYTKGFEDYPKIPDGSVDYLISDAVFEHIRKNIFRDTIRETYRFMAPGGRACHIVDLKDHFGGGKNNLRFPDSRWEDEAHYRMDNYTNRLTCQEICQICRECGFRVVSCRRRLFKKPPLPRRALAEQFRDMPDRELRTADFLLILEK